MRWAEWATMRLSALASSRLHTSSRSRASAAGAIRHCCGAPVADPAASHKTSTRLPHHVLGLAADDPHSLPLAEQAHRHRRMPYTAPSTMRTPAPSVHCHAWVNLTG